VEDPGSPDAKTFIASCEDPGPGQEHIDLRRLPAQLRLEVQYVLQCRRDEQRARLLPSRVQEIVRGVAAARACSLLEEPEGYWVNAGPPTPRTRRIGWRAFILDARRRIEALAFGCGWEVEYPRDTWRLCSLGTGQPEAIISFGQISQPWLKALAKRWARWQLTTGLSASTAGTGVRAVARFASFLASQPAAAVGLADVDRPLLERYLAGLRAEMSGRQCHLQHVGALNGFLRAIRQHGWDDTLPASAMIFSEDYPSRGHRLPVRSPPMSCRRSSSPPALPGRTTPPTG
jgi:hypothetical protein